jgi:hypothetical protein
MSAKGNEIMVHPGGRPTKMTPETINKLEYAFALGCSDKEACCYADICHQVLYNYQNKHPEFVERKQQLKQWPFLKARKAVIRDFEEKGGGDLALKFLERRKKSEFSLRQEHEISEHRITITQDHADKILEAAKKTKDE